jgi:hypothetical protein
MWAQPPTPSGERAPPDSGDSRLAGIWRTRYPDAGATEVLLSPLLGTTFDEASRAAEALA